MSEELFCPFCGSANVKTNAFCSNCGASLSEKPIQQTTPTTPQPTIPVQQSQQTYYPPPTQPYTYGSTTTYIPSRPAQQTNTPAIVSFICAIASIILSFIPFIIYATPVLIIVAFIFGIIGLKNPYQKGFAIAGLVISSCGLLLFILVIVLFAFFYGFIF